MSQTASKRPCMPTHTLTAYAHGATNPLTPVTTPTAHHSPSHSLQGRHAQNRAVEGDHVAVRVLPEALWLRSSEQPPTTPNTHLSPPHNPPPAANIVPFAHAHTPLQQHHTSPLQNHTSAALYHPEYEEDEGTPHTPQCRAHILGQEDTGLHEQLSLRVSLGSRNSLEGGPSPRECSGDLLVPSTVPEGEEESLQPGTAGKLASRCVRAHVCRMCTYVHATVGAMVACACIRMCMRTCMLLCQLLHCTCSPTAHAALQQAALRMHDLSLLCYVCSTTACMQAMDILSKLTPTQHNMLQPFC